MRRNKLAENLTVAVVLGGASTYAVARMDTNDARTLPYQGTLEQSGAAANGDYLMRFGLFVASPSVNELQCVVADNCPLWSEEQLVTVQNGRFSVLLGDSDGDLTDQVLSSNALFLGMAVKEASSPDTFTLLDGVQEIAPAPWAARAAAAKDFKVTGDVTVGGDVAVTGSLIADQRIGIGTSAPTVDLDVANGALRVVDADNLGDANIAQFYAQNLTQGIGVAYNRLEMIGSLGTLDLYLQGKGTDGRVFTQARRSNNGTVTTYWRSTKRYLFEAPVEVASGGSTALGSVDIPESVLVELCGPPDGCTIRTGMREWCPTADCDSSTGLGPFSFWYGDQNNGRHLWRRSTPGIEGGQEIGTPSSGYDGDGAVNHVVRDFNCYFTDGLYTNGTGTSSDAAVGMTLLNWNTGYTGTVTCWLTIDD